MNSDNIAWSHSHISCSRDFLRRTVKGDQDDWKPFNTMRLELCCMDGMAPLSTVSTKSCFTIYARNRQNCVRICFATIHALMNPRGTCSPVTQCGTVESYRLVEEMWSEKKSARNGRKHLLVEHRTTRLARPTRRRLRTLRSHVNSKIFRLLSFVAKPRNAGTWRVGFGWRRKSVRQDDGLPTESQASPIGVLQLRRHTRKQNELSEQQVLPLQ